jgi:hypothetical protein
VLLIRQYYPGNNALPVHTSPIMKHEARRAAIAAYKRRVVPAGIFSIRCTATGQCWVGKAIDLSTIPNRLRFTLSRGVSTHETLQEAWRRHGGACFDFETVETLDKDLTDYMRDRALRERLEYWQTALQAESI